MRWVGAVGRFEGASGGSDSLRGKRPYGPTSQSPAGDSSPFRGATAQVPPSAVGREGRGQVGVLLVRCIYPLGCGDGRPFLGWCVTEDVYSLTACPAGGHFLARQKVTKERPGLRPGPDGQRRQSLGGRSPNAAWTAWARFFCLGDSLNLIVWLLNAWLGGWPCWGVAPSGLARLPVAPAPSFRLA